MNLYYNYYKLLFILVSALLLPIAAQNKVSNDNSGNTPIGKITLPLGKVTSQPPGKYSWLRARVNQDVFINERIRTKSKSRCEVTFSPKNVLRIGENSIITLEESKLGVSKYMLSSGRSWLSIFTKNNNIELRTPGAVAAIRGTVFRVDCDKNYSTFRVYSGRVDVTPLNPDGETISDTSFRVEAGNEIRFVNDFDEYIKNYMKEMDEFKDQKESEFQQFVRQRNVEYQNFVNEQKKAFTAYKSIYYTQTAIDILEDRKLPWVSWNLERDILLEK